MLIYGVLWLIVFMAPALDMYQKVSANAALSFHWESVYGAWGSILPFLILFLIHDFLLFPRLLLRRKIVAYMVSVVCVLAVFHVLQGSGRPEKVPPRVFQEQQDRRLPDGMPLADGRPPRMDKPENGLPRVRPGGMFNPDLLRLVIAVLMLGLNIAIKLLFKSQRDENVLKELERQKLQQELTYLRYQINPHFFMNTLNNIHALVDIDAEKAKETILELSRLMRYVLYEGEKRTVQLAREVEFLKHYIALMRLRYTDKVSIVVDMPYAIPDVEVPPLLFISFVENAFKHGISYQSDSFIHLSMRLDGGELFFCCENSCHAANEDPHSGIGLENVRKRLQLLYGDEYNLQIEEEDGVFEVLLVIPVTA